MSKLIYISPSIFPSKAANSTHVILQVDALEKLYDQILVIGMAARNVKNVSGIKTQLIDAYGVSLENVDFALCRNILGFAENLLIALFSVRFILLAREANVITRNIYAAILCVVFIRHKFIYETHTVETGFRAILQRFLLCSQDVEVIVISKSLKGMLIKKYDLSKYKITVLHDAARQSLPSKINNIKIFPDADKFANILGYFGSLHRGRGIDVIEAMAGQLPDSLFMVFGPPGQNPEFEERARYLDSNIKFCGFIPHTEIHENMMRCDILLMPYQKKVSIGPSSSDTSKWMSPMKMFEYMAAGRPIISSDLPVLHEVLRDKVNALFVTPHNVQEWIEASEMLRADSSLSDKLASNARSEYESKYNWAARAAKIKLLFARSII